MARAISLFSTSTITAKGLETVMTYLGATPDEYGWVLTRDERTVWVELGTEDIPDMPDDIIDEAALELDGVPKSRVVVVFDDSKPDQMEYRMARAVGIALAERCPIVLHNHASEAEMLFAPGQGPRSD